ncbi:MAG: efflux RND transporter periplasmic adaptor subunit [Gammaproteobacteria bacterium]|nr:efflux RND transporter periplasmic adaptor subunit [Gammaproteobacteria bacterium]
MFTLLRKHPVITVISVVIVVLIIWGFLPQPVLVEMAKVSRAPLTVTIEEEGRTRVMDRYVVAAPVDGVTCRVQLHVGDAVKQGEVLLNITPLQSQVLDARSRAQALAKIESAKSALRAAEERARAAAANEQLANNDLKRMQPLMEKGVVSKDAYDKALTTANTAAANKRSADFTVDVARYELDAAKSVLEYGTGATQNSDRVKVRSPVNGKILKLAHECAGPIRTGEPLLEVGDPSALEIEVDVLSADAVRIKPGMQVLFDRWGGEQPLEGKVRNVEPVGFTKVSALGVEEQRVLVISDFTSPPEQWQQLGDGYRVEARFILWHEDKVLQVPASSLFRYNNGWAVFIVKNNQAHRQTVNIGQRNGLIAQILDGVNEGDIVINHPSDDVEDGRRVKIQTIE